MHPDPAGEGAPHGTHSASVPGWDGRGLRSALVGVQGSSRAIAALTPGCKTRRPCVDGWVASAFRRSGHRTAAVGNWHLGMRWLDKGGDRFHAEGGLSPRRRRRLHERAARQPARCRFRQVLRHFGLSRHEPYCFLRNRSVEALREIPAPSTQVDIFSGLAAGLRSQNFQVEEAARIIDLHAGRDRPLYLYLALASPHLPNAPVGGAMVRVGR